MTGLWVEHQLETDTKRSRWGKYLHLSGLMCNIEAWGTGTTPGLSTQGAPQPSLCRERAPGRVCVSGVECSLLKRPFVNLSISPVKKMTVRDLPQPLLDLPEEHVPNQETVRSQAPKGTVTGKAGFPHLSEH